MPLARRRNPAVLTPNIPTGVQQIVGGHRRFYLRKPIDLDLRREAGHWVLEYPPLNILAWGDTEEEAYACFAEDFDAVWNHIVEAPDSELEGNARKLKAAFKQLVEHVENQ